MARKKLQTVYLYADGHAVAVWAKDDREAGAVEWVELHERWGPTVHFGEGRLVLRPELAQLLRGRNVVGVDARPADVEAGSQNTRERGIALDTLELRVRGTDHPVILHGIPEWLSGPWYYQEDIDETFNETRDKSFWSEYRVTKVHEDQRRKREEATA